MDINTLGIALHTGVTFVHFKNPKTDEPVYLPGADGKPDESKPVGVNIYGPGTKHYRESQSAITQEAIDRKRRKITAELLSKNAVELVARLTVEYVNFEYNGKGASLDNNRAFYGDEKFEHLRDQVQEKLGDVGGFLASVSSN